MLIFTVFICFSYAKFYKAQDCGIVEPVQSHGQWVTDSPYDVHDSRVTNDTHESKIHF